MATTGEGTMSPRCALGDHHACTPSGFGCACRCHVGAVLTRPPRAEVALRLRPVEAQVWLEREGEVGVRLAAGVEVVTADVDGFVQWARAAAVAVELLTGEVTGPADVSGWWPAVEECSDEHGNHFGYCPIRGCGVAFDASASDLLELIPRHLRERHGLVAS